ncbi:MAG: AraC family transcriptional regulator [Gammaproteobacteria bacterium]
MKSYPHGSLRERQQPAIGVVVLVQLLREFDQDPDPLLAAEGLPASHELSCHRTVAASRELGFIQRVVDLGLDPELGLLAGQRHHFGVFGMWGMAIVSSETVRDAIRLGLRYIDLTHTFLHWSFANSREGPMLSLRQRWELAGARRFVFERDLAAAATLLVDLLGNRQALARIALPYPAPGTLRRYQEIFACELLFDRPDAEIMLHPEWLDARPIQANPMAAHLAEEQCQQLVAQMSGAGSTVQAVREILMAQPGQFATLDQVALRLKTSARSLRRKLAAESSSYRKVLGQVRETLAKAYLRDTSLTIEEIAARLNYSDAANFSHAFQRWSGTAPGRYRADSGINARRQP